MGAARPHASPSSPARGITARLTLAAGDIKLAHSVFALPFALLGAFLAWRGSTEAPPTISGARFAALLGLVVICMVLARTWAMLINRLADAKFDAANPRTARRVIASGQLAYRDGVLLAILCALGFIAACSAFYWLQGNLWPLALCLPVLAWLALYSFAKRFTALCHVLLGTALAISPLAAALAIAPHALQSVMALWWLAGMVTLWVAGFDVLYALQDEQFDKRTGLHSLPAALGPSRAVWLSRTMHFAAAGCMVMVARSGSVGLLFTGAVVVAIACLIAEHVVLVRRGLAGLPLAFFTLNGVISLVLGTAGIVDVLMR